MTGADEDLAIWDGIAAQYAACVGEGADSTYQRFRQFIWRHLGEDLTGLHVLDLGCGHGWLAGMCRARGASVVGVDGSDDLLTRARARFPDVEFEHADLSSGLPASVRSQSFDRVVAHMVLMDVPSLDTLAGALDSCLAADGAVVVTMPHPSFFNQSPVEDPGGERYRKVTGYLAHDAWWISTFGGHRHYHRPLEFYVKWLAAAGLGVVDLHEPPVPLAQPEADRDAYERWFVNIPTMLGMAARRIR
ncbi:MAG: class I SAM-dependent methyltransferase [Acidimicrobiales bacterium]